jgi:hypothetical protein
VYLSAIRAKQSDDVFEQHALAGSGTPDNYRRLATFDLEIDIVEHALPAERLAHAAKLDDRIVNVHAGAPL